MFKHCFHLKLCPCIFILNQYKFCPSFIHIPLNIHSLYAFLGHWVLLDEINLASAETLQCLSGLLEGSTSSVSLLERGDKVEVPRHPNFRLLAAMNPANDFGKKDLPLGIRNR